MYRKRQRPYDIICLHDISIKSGLPNMPTGTAASLKLEMGELTIAAHTTDATAHLPYRQITGVESSAETIAIRYTSLRVEDKTLSFTIDRSAAGALPMFIDNLKILAGIHAASFGAPAQHITL